MMESAKILKVQIGNNIYQYPPEEMTDGFDRIDDPRDLERYINETSGDVRREIRNVSDGRGTRDLRELKGWSP